jgi:hypothetical protein
MHSDQTKSNRGRTYLTATLRDNTLRWTEAFLRQARLKADKAPLSGLTIGFRASLDPGEQVVEARNNRLDAPPGTRPSATFRVRAAIVNGLKTLDKQYALPPLDASTTRGRAGAASAGEVGNRLGGPDTTAPGRPRD